jgi:hypothetical protein
MDSEAFPPAQYESKKNGKDNDFFISWAWAVVEYFLLHILYLNVKLLHYYFSLLNPLVLCKHF